MTFAYGFIYFVGFFSPIVCAWHAYFDGYEANYTSSCPDFRTESMTRINLDIYNDYGLWEELLLRKSGHERTVFGFQLAMRKIFEHQHPQDCSNKRFLIPQSSYTSGFGSHHHTDGVALAVAMNSGRILIQNPESPMEVSPNEAYLTNGAHCRSQKTFSMECYYLSWSNCSLTDVLGKNRLKPISNTWDLRGLKMFPYERIDRAMEKTVILKNLYLHNAQKYLVPRQFTKLLACSPMKSVHHHYYWWRAMSVAFLVRPNTATKLLIKKLSANETLSPPPEIFGNKQRPIVGVYIRTGDKADEMKLPRIDSYESAASILWGKVVKGYNHYNHTSKQMFLSSEDPEVFMSASAWKVHGWDIYNTELFKRDGLTAAADARVKDQQRRSHTTLHHEFEYISALMNVEMMVKCDAFVCTMASNTCRLIDELRATVGAKPNASFADLSEETCRTPPCVDGYGIYDLNW